MGGADSTRGLTQGQGGKGNGTQSTVAEPTYDPQMAQMSADGRREGVHRRKSATSADVSSSPSILGGSEAGEVGGDFNAYLANSALVGQITFRQGANVRLTTTRAYDAVNRLSRTHSAPSGANQLPVGYSYQLNAADQRLRAELADPAGAGPAAGEQFEYGFDETCPVRE